ncbi:GMC family oxidoreductase N-terminal domain-containing protein [Bradyrhizobium sp. Ash2021]|uniref:GMC family oxidoreductase n=1 Tax=Bradyrhizobium sp. Ash2021 TaxID=2954771 RepID=UPI002815BA9C|nr:GMC family oxidoreductase N-terminal domain-containing protein [Bradyrhizobium sp. Ash2021]WMT76501.1 GMC family oxidoreductase N-terminal domain-containing protein [Bradyrhizobium sp. Ash2021]
MGAGSAGCVIAARLSEDPACRVLLIEAGGADISRPALQTLGALASQFRNRCRLGQSHSTAGPSRRARHRLAPEESHRGSSSINAMIWVWGHAADFDQWAYAGDQGWDYASLRPVSKSIETCARQTSSGERGSHGPMHVGPVAETSPLTVSFLKAGEEMGHEVLEGVNAPLRDGAGFMDFNIKDGRRFSVVRGYLLPALERQNLTLLTRARVDALSFQRSRCTGIRFRIGTEQFEVNTDRETVLCAGAIELPRLLMLSGVGNAEELRRYGVFKIIHSSRPSSPKRRHRWQPHPAPRASFSFEAQRKPRHRMYMLCLALLWWVFPKSSRMRLFR